MWFIALCLNAYPFELQYFFITRNRKSFALALALSAHQYFKLAKKLKNFSGQSFERKITNNNYRVSSKTMYFLSTLP